MNRNRRFLAFLTAAFALALAFTYLPAPQPASAQTQNLWAGVHVSRSVLRVGQQTRLIFNFGNQNVPNFWIQTAVCLVFRTDGGFQRDPIFLNTSNQYFDLLRMEGTENGKYLSAPIYAPWGTNFRTVYTLRSVAKATVRVSCSISGHEDGNPDNRNFASSDVIIATIR
jgi:hypothetical protein